MPIRCVCPNGHALRVKDKLAGKRGTCPKCQAEFVVPPLAASDSALAGGPPPAPPQTPPPAPAPASPAPPAPPAEPPAVPAAASPSEGVEWLLARPDGEQFGPTVPTVFAQWIVAGRVPADSMVWRTGWQEWRRADDPDAQLPAPLPEKSGGSAQAAGVTLPPPFPTAPPVSPAPSPASAPGGAYAERRRQQARRRRTVSIALAVVCVVLAGLLVALVLNGPPAGAPVVPAAPP